MIIIILTNILFFNELTMNKHLVKKGRQMTRTKINIIKSTSRLQVKLIENRLVDSQLFMQNVKFFKLFNQTT
jgi:hypothetical protein